MQNGMLTKSLCKSLCTT